MRAVTKKFLSVLSGLAQNPPPFWFMRQAGRYLPEYMEVRNKAGSFLNLCMNSNAAAEVTLQPIRRFGMDAAIIFADILLIPLALGVELKFVENEGPKLGSYQLETLNFDNSKLLPVYEALKIVSSKLPKETSLIGFAGSPWTVATYMVEQGSSRDFKKTKLLALQNPKHFAALIDKIVNASILYLKQQILAGAEVIQLFDSWAGELQEDEFEKWVIEPTAQICSALKAEFPHIKIIGFPRKCGALVLGYAKNAGVDAISLDSSMPLAWAKNNINLPLQGNLDPQILLCDNQTLKRHATNILQTMKGHAFIFNLGHGITPQTPPQSIEFLSDLIKNST